MRINTNISAMNAHRQLTANQAGTSKSLEKLSSGLRINRAGDDAAGLAISEKMRGQIRGLDQATRNAQDGISLIQTAEGALDESHAILQRMRELSVQAANDTLTQDDRNAIQDEINQLAEEISRIGKNTEFNTQTLLDGSFNGRLLIGANHCQSVELNIGDKSAYNLGIAGDAKYEVEVESGEVENIGEGTYTVELVEGYEVEDGENHDVYVLYDEGGNEVGYSIDGDAYNVGIEIDGDDNLSLDGENIVDFGDDTVTSGEVVVDEEGDLTATATLENQGLEPGSYVAIQDEDDNHVLVVDNDKQELVAEYDDTENGYVVDGEVVLEVDAALADGTEVKVEGINVSTRVDADEALLELDSAIENVSANRSTLGAMQNRLEHTINNLGTASENLSAAESRIRDVDMADEMMEFTKQSILEEAATAMLAQANMQPQNILQLLG